MKHRKDATSLVLAAVVSLILVGLLGGGAIVWKKLDQSEANQTALANQVKALGGTPVVQPKAGAPGDQGPRGPMGLQGVQGPPGIQGKQGPIGITGQSPRCLLEPSRCVGPKGATGNQGKIGDQGSQGEPGTAGKTGDQGIPGVAGKDGAPGQPGAAGADGTDGADGKPGPPGPDTSALKCASMNGELQELTVTTTDPLTQAKILVCVLK